MFIHSTANYFRICDFFPNDSCFHLGIIVVEERDDVDTRRKTWSHWHFVCGWLERIIFLRRFYSVRRAIIDAPFWSIIAQDNRGRRDYWTKVLCDTRGVEILIEDGLGRTWTEIPIADIICQQWWTIWVQHLIQLTFFAVFLIENNIFIEFVFPCRSGEWCEPETNSTHRELFWSVGRCVGEKGSCAAGRGDLNEDMQKETETATILFI